MIKIEAANIRFTKNSGISQAIIRLKESKNLISEWDIEGGEISKDEETNIIFKECYIENCVYSVKESEGLIPRGLFIDSCRIKNCKLPLAYYLSCTFKNGDKVEISMV